MFRPRARFVAALRLTQHQQYPQQQSTSNYPDEDEFGNSDFAGPSSSSSNPSPQPQTMAMMSEQQQQQQQSMDGSNYYFEDSGAGGRMGRERAQEREIAGQFASLQGGWQAGDDARFDLFVEEKRRARAFEEFDQRVQRAFGRAVRQHRAEVWNGFKRKLKRTGDKLTPQVLEHVQRAIAEREEWLRDMFTQIDADYRSDDADRQARAATDLRAALDGRSGELLLPHYESKLARRHAGPKKQQLLEQEMEDDADSPAISNDEMNRYAGLKTNMAAVEDAVVSRYGRAGREHWDMLQSEKDAEYMAKINDAAGIYKGLLDQQKAYDESQSAQPLKQYVRRISSAQVRFRAAMEVEATREELIDAHEAMKKKRRDDAEQRRLERFKEYNEMRRTGVPSLAARKTLQIQSLDKLNEDLSRQVAAEKDDARKRKRLFTQMVDQLEYDAEQQEGENWMMTATTTTTTPEQQQHQQQVVGGTKKHPKDFSDVQIQAALDDAAQLANTFKKSGQVDPAWSDETITKKALWQVLNRDTWEDPFRTVHNARVRAGESYSELYTLTTPDKLRLGRKSDRGMGANVTAGGEAKMLQDPWIEHHALTWGMTNVDVHDLDPDGSKDYLGTHRGWHVRDPKTNDIDFRYEKRLGRGTRWTGPKFYKQGIDAKGKPEDRPMVESPDTKRSKVKL